MAHSHSHFGDPARQTTTRIALALGCTLAFVVIEAVAGYWSNSLALLSDAVHNVTDAIALGLSWYALRLTARPANSQKTFGYHRAGILVALANSATLVLIALGILREAYLRFLFPAAVEANILIGVGLLAVAINLGTAWLVKQGSDHDLNLRSAFTHLMGDVASTIGAVIAGIVIAFTGLNWFDPLVSVLISALILRTAWSILQEAVNILLEGTPQDLDMPVLVRDLQAVSGVRGVHDLHAWSITQNLRALSAHIVTGEVSPGTHAQIRRAVNKVLSQSYNITHVTLQLESEGCDPAGLYCDMANAAPQRQHSH